MLLAAVVHPLPPARLPADSFTGWILLTVVLALIVAAGVVVSSRR